MWYVKPTPSNCEKFIGPQSLIPRILKASEPHREFSFIQRVELLLICRRSKWVTTVGLGSAAIADLLIAGSMVFFLKRARTGIPR
jgi:hypothetical protein